MPKDVPTPTPDSLPDLAARLAVVQAEADRYRTLVEDLNLT